MSDRRLVKVARSYRHVAGLPGYRLHVRL